MTHLHKDHRTILLIDQNINKQNLRATVLRNYEVEVHTANSITDAAKLWITNSYDLVLLAAQENSEDAIALSTQFCEGKQRTRVGLLVGTPLYLREVGRTRKKVASIGGVLSADTEVSSNPSPQWQETVRRLVTDWYADQSAALELSNSANRPAGA